MCVCMGMYVNVFQLTLRAATAQSVPSYVAVSPDRIKCAEPAFLSMHSHTWRISQELWPNSLGNTSIRLHLRD